MDITLHAAAQRLLEADHILILSHQSPDGDTLGCASALLRGLRQLGKQAGFRCSDAVPKKFEYLFAGLEEQAFSPAFVVSVDIADQQLFGAGLAEYLERVDLCIDHHGTNSRFAKECYVEPGAAAACEIVFLLLQEMKVEITPEIADCLFTGLCTDTGCFRYGNVTPRTHRMAAELIERGAQAAEINRVMFDTKTHGRLEVERCALQGMSFHFDGQCAFMYIPRKLVDDFAVEEGELDGLAALPRQVEGVLAGVCVREMKDGSLKVSLRTNAPLNAARICEAFGGGGHNAAAGCAFQNCTIEEVKEKLLAEIQRHLEGCKS